MPLDFSTGRKPVVEFSLASLTDMVLLLLIFFLLTSSFSVQRGVQVTLPQVSESAPLEQQYVAVTITDDGRFFVEDTETAEDALVATIEGVRGERDALAVYADEEATVGQLAAVASAGSALDMRVALATDVREE
ncbi:MAG TPA: biopolymer transporter ExbD [Rubricoccaceae bacterium]|nr:biopolymer transporter ExbD [Rubricoccaceae bacterium]